MANRSTIQTRFVKLVINNFREYFDNSDTRSLRELGIENYPYPEMPGDAGVKLSRTQERQSLQNLNNRLAGYIDKVRNSTLKQDQ